MSDEALYELKVLEGKDAGKEIPLQGSMITLGRSPDSLKVTPGSILFEEGSVARIHAVLMWSPEEKVYRISNRSPISPAMVNGTPVANATLAPGTTLQLGQLVAKVNATADLGMKIKVEVHPVLPPQESVFLGEEQPGDVPKGPPPPWLRHGDTPAEQPAPKPRKRKLREEEEEPEASAQPPKAEAKAKPKAKAAAEPGPEAALPPEQTLKGFLELVKGGGKKGHRVPVYWKPTTLGRSPECDVAVEESRVSRHHASIVWESDLPILVHESASNTTKVGRTKVTGRHTLTPDDEITLADRVVMRWEPL